MSQSDWDETAPIAESGYARRLRSRHRRTAVTLVLVLLALFSAFWYAFSYYQSNRDTPAPRKVCVTPTPAVRPGTFTLNVYNATDRDGLAGSVSKSLTARGFRVGAVANDPLKRTVKAAAEVRSGPAGTRNARLVAEQVAGSLLVVDRRRDAGVDLVLGEGYKALSVPKPAPSVTCTTPTG